MLDFSEWRAALGGIRDELNHLDEMIAYRKMALRCTEDSDPRRRLSEAQQEILDADPILRELDYRREYYLKKRLFIQQNGELPPKVET